MTMRKLVWIALAVSVVVVMIGQPLNPQGLSTSVSGAADRRGVSPTLGTAQDMFTINGSPTFLLGVSYFDARHWRASDLDRLSRRGFNLIRIRVDFRDIGFLDPAGRLVDENHLTQLIRAAGARGMVVDVTILDADMTCGVANAEQAVRSVVSALKSEPNVLYDVMNEHDHRGDNLSHKQIARLIEIILTEHPNAVVTVSSQERHIVNDLRVKDGNIDDELAAGVNVMTPHFLRTSDWSEKTALRVKVLKEYLAARGHVMPVYLQEEARRRHSGLNPTTDEFLRAAQGARAAGAAGWIFHTDAGFDLRNGSFFDNLDPVEEATIEALAPVFAGSL